LTDREDEYPLPNEGNLQIHDPNVLLYDHTFYAFKGAPSIQYFQAPSMGGPWTLVGKVLNGPSIIDKKDQTRPWAPTAIELNGTFYCFYAISRVGSRNSSIGVATSHSLNPGSWTDHGALINTGGGDLSDVFPYTVSNAIDPSVIIDQDGKPWLAFGSFWTDIWQVPLTDNMLSVENPSAPAANHLTFIDLPGDNNDLTDLQGTRPEEGSWISYRTPYYYLWFSHGQCCYFNPKKLPPAGQEYSIRMGRSLNVSGPYVDKDGQSLLGGGGQTIYASNHDVVYAPGGLGVVTTDMGADILYFHYLNMTVGLGFNQSLLGWNYLDYEDGWPTPISGTEAPVSQPKKSTNQFSSATTSSAQPTSTQPVGTQSSSGQATMSSLAQTHSAKPSSASTKSVDKSILYVSFLALAFLLHFASAVS
jgi:arabinan endo-1,5-alpha-L-arabinosidase